MQNLQKVTNYLQLNKLDDIKALEVIKEKTTLKPSILVLIISVFLILVSLIVDISPIVIGIGCVFIPGYFTLQTIGTRFERQCIKYLVYWLMFGINEVVFQPVFGLIFGNTFLMIFQVALSVALLHPKFNFALIIYDRIIRDLINKDKPNQMNIPASAQQNQRQTTQTTHSVQNPIREKTQ